MNEQATDTVKKWLLELYELPYPETPGDVADFYAKAKNTAEYTLLLLQENDNAE